ncbi:mid1-interacting protein 1-B-like [Carcharodon carcharias]|uniref:mid1-interacting protein 1-B-like n=1 Tax=Carcharodon carcharias TaxID=13397 RepID=UPI001B7DD2CC|nr:mid1-interacting protein 1-B-like [Carcharodon carcharias]
MMQITDFKNNRSSLFNALNRFITAVTVMGETIMVPSLLLDLPVEEEDNHSESNVSKQRDMYENYLLLKSIRNDIEWGIPNEQIKSDLESRKAREEDTDSGDLQRLFHHHVNGLYNVLSKLTLQANHLTNRYTRELGINDLGR